MKSVDVSNGFDLGCFHFVVEVGKEADLDLRSRVKYGECSHSRKTISISQDYSLDQFHATYLHEVVEAVTEECCNGKISHDNITNLANGLAQVFKSLGIMFQIEEKHKV